MQDQTNYVQQFQDQMSHRIRVKPSDQQFNYPNEDFRLREKPRVRKIEPRSQIAQQGILKNYSQHESLNQRSDSLQQFCKPLINYQVQVQDSNKLNFGRYNHNYAYLGQGPLPKERIDAPYQQEPFNQPQSDYYSRSQPQITNNNSTLNENANPNRLSYSSVGNMLMGQSQLQNNQPQQYNQAQHPALPNPAGHPNLFSPQHVSQKEQPYYGSRALKNLDSTHLY